ncbi:MAG: glycosyltransferase family 4 protein [Planctomycetes bacterium]|nr:glycosyltransferase family 4 protein [Planctomycetota bacterium]
MSGHLALLAEGLDPARGGAERAVRATALALAARGVDVRAYAPADRRGPDLPGVPIVGVAAPRVRPLRDLALSRGLARAARAAGAGRVVACGKLLDADAWWPHGGVHAAARAAWTRAGRSPLRGAVATASRALRPTERVLDAIEARAADACRAGRARCLALSARVARDLARAHGLTPHAVVGNGVDPARFAPPTRTRREEAARALARRAGAPEGAPVALFVAHAFRLKGLDLLLRAAAQVPDLHVVVAGGDDPGGARALAGRLGLGRRVALLGPVEDVAALYHGATALAHPSRYDPCSLVVLEALACGLPVLASPEDGAAERVGAGGRVVAALEDPGAWAAALREVLDPGARAAMSAAAAAARRTWDDVAGDLLAALG